MSSPLILTHPPQSGTAPALRLRVWDLPLRLFHWALVAAVTLAAASGFLLDSRALALHLLGGGIAAGLVAARVVWGFLGPTHARFAAFLRGPGPVLAHLRSLTRPQRLRHLGHNPLGALMVVAVLAVVLALAATGLAALGGVLKAGPLGFALGFDAGLAARALHKALAIGLLVMIALHLGGVLVESLRGHENLVRAMIDGCKAARTGDEPVLPRRARPVRVAALCLALAALAWGGGVRLAALPVPGLPPAAFPARYAAECSDCHAAYSPSLLPAASWRALMDGLDNHFGENASLDPATRDEIAAWLAGHSAETADTLAAHALRRVNPEDPLRITATPFWQHMHGRLPARLFDNPAVGGRGNCGACHADAAQGLFYPTRIDVPKETRP